jgi:hypothetical protein
MIRTNHNPAMGTYRRVPAEHSLQKECRIGKAFTAIEQIDTELICRRGVERQSQHGTGTNMNGFAGWDRSDSELHGMCCDATASRHLAKPSGFAREMNRRRGWASRANVWTATQRNGLAGGEWIRKV